VHAVDVGAVSKDESRSHTGESGVAWVVVLTGSNGDRVVLRLGHLWSLWSLRCLWSVWGLVFLGGLLCFGGRGAFRAQWGLFASDDARDEVCDLGVLVVVREDGDVFVGDLGWVDVSHLGL